MAVGADQSIYQHYRPERLSSGLAGDNRGPVIVGQLQGRTFNDSSGDSRGTGSYA